jgi:predicted nucleic acid-binding protein
MICLDANFLIGGVIETRAESRHLIAWAEAGEAFCTAAPAWYEFLCGPVSPAQIETMQAFLKGGIIPFAARQAEIAARLFNAVERQRRLRVDAMIAATSISQQAPLATLNAEDFTLFASHGLTLAGPPPSEF